MANPIGPAALGGALPIANPVPAAAPARSQPGAFNSLLENAIDRVQNLQQTADQSIDRFLSGEGEELHETVLATQRAELAFELFLQVRNKVVQAYQEVMRMQM